MAYIGKTPSQAVRSRYFYTAAGGETSLSGADDNGDTLIFADGNYVDVYLNGVLLVASSDYNVNTVNTIAGLTALTASDIVEIVVYDTFSVFGGTFQGTLTANQFVGPLTGNVTGELNGAINFIVKNLSGGTITKGTPVYISGHSGNTPEVNVADADDPAKMPAIGVATEDFNNNTQGNIVTFGDLIGFNTAAFSVNDELYVSTTGTLTATRPNASNTEVQKIAKVVRSHSTNGQLFIMGAGRSNDVPNAITTNSINLGSTTTVDSVLDEDAMTSDSATALATQQSIKAYVDSQIGSNNELSEILTNGNTTGGNDISFADNDKAIFGAGSDLEIYHDGSASIVYDNGTGPLNLQTNNSNINIKGGSSASHTMAIFKSTEGVDLYYNNVKKFETTATGVDVTGNATFPDNGKAIFGAGNDLQIYHDSNDSYINDTGTGNLRLAGSANVEIISSGGEFMAKFVADGASTLYHNNAAKLATTSFGAQVTGSLAVDTITNATASTDVTIDTNFNIILDAGSNVTAKCTAGSGNYALGAYNPTSTSSRAIALFQSNVGGTQANKVVIQCDGKVGIGTASPPYKLSISEDGNNFLQFNQSGDSVAGSLIGRSSSKDLRIQQSENADIQFWTNNSEKMRLNPVGRFWVGEATGTILNGNGAEAKTGIMHYTNTQNSFTVIQSNGSNAALYVTSGPNRTTAVLIQFGRNGSGVGSISTNGTTTSYNTSSDYRLKENVVADWDATTRLKQLNPVRFNFIADADTTVDGFLAHEVQDVVPEAITGTHNGMRDEEYEVTPAVLDDDGNEVTPAVMGTRSVPDLQGIDQSKLVPLLVKTIQELEARITALETAE